MAALGDWTCGGGYVQAMPQSQVTLNFDDELRRLLEAEAAAEGVTIQAYAREAVLMRLMTTMRQRQDPKLETFLDHLRRTAGDPATRGSAEQDAVAAVVQSTVRLCALQATELLDSPPEERFDRIVRLAAEALGVPVAAVSLVDQNRQFFKSAVGLPPNLQSERETPLEYSFCQYAVASGEPLIVEDARQDPVLGDNPSVEELDVVSYVGIPLKDPNGQVLGTLCVWDSKTRELTRGHVQILEDLARMTTQRIADEDE